MSKPLSSHQFLTCAISGLTVVERARIEDNRGFLSRLYAAEPFLSIGLSDAIAEVNHTLTRRPGAVRGMHFQCPPHAEIKVVSCVHGEIFDVAVDLRKGSATFLQWHGEVLSAENRRSLVIPQGFAHGFQALSSDCELIYLHTAAYDPSAEGAVNVSDPRLAIRWPLEITQLSDRDRSHPMLTSDFEGIPK